MPETHISKEAYEFYHKKNIKGTDDEVRNILHARKI